MENTCRVLCVHFLPPAFFWGHLSLVCRCSTIMSGILSSSEKGSLLKFVLEKETSVQCLGTSVLGTEGLWAHLSAPYLLMPSPHKFVSFMPLAWVPVSIADPWVGVVYPGFSTQHKNSFGLG